MYRYMYMYMYYYFIIHVGGWTPVANDNLNGGGLTMLARDGRLVASSADVLVSSPGRRALTLSTTGSDAESNYSCEYIDTALHL